MLISVMSSGGQTPASSRGGGEPRSFMGAPRGGRGESPGKRDDGAAPAVVRLRWVPFPGSADLLRADARKAPSRLEPWSSQFGQVQAVASGLHLAPFPWVQRQPNRSA